MELFEYPYRDEANAILNWCTAGGRNSVDQVEAYLTLKDPAIVEDVSTCWKFETITNADLAAQLKKFRADFAADPMISPEYDPKHQLVAKDYTVVNGEPDAEYDDSSVIIPDDQPRRSAI